MSRPIRVLLFLVLLPPAAMGALFLAIWLLFMAYCSGKLLDPLVRDEAPKGGNVASHSREQRIVRAVPCSYCGARIGELCRVNPKSREGQNRPILHTERRRAYQSLYVAGDSARNPPTR